MDTVSSANTTMDQPLSSVVVSRKALTSIIDHLLDMTQHELDHLSIVLNDILPKHNNTADNTAVRVTWRQARTGMYIGPGGKSVNKLVELLNEGNTEIVPEAIVHDVKSYLTALRVDSHTANEISRPLAQYSSKTGRSIEQLLDPLKSLVNAISKSPDLPSLLRSREVRDDIMASVSKMRGEALKARMAIRDDETWRSTNPLESIDQSILPAWVVLKAKIGMLETVRTEGFRAGLQGEWLDASTILSRCH